jgi:hypothetical protein
MQTNYIKRKWLAIGVSICAVVLLVLGSLSNVVGYQSVKSTVNDSPLFETRMQRAKNQQQNSITSRFLGMEKGNLWQIPLRDNGIEQLKKAIDIIKKMDDKAFARFTELCIQRAKQDQSLKELTPSNIIKALHTLKTQSVIIINSFMNRDKQMVSASGLFTFCQFPGCVPFFILKYVLESIVILLSIIYFKFISYCSDTYSPCGAVSKMHNILGGES